MRGIKYFDANELCDIVPIRKAVVVLLGTMFRQPTSDVVRHAGIKDSVMDIG